MKCYDRGLEIAKATFPEKSTEPLVEFQLNLHSVSDNIDEVTIDISGTKHTYRSEPDDWVTVTWPAKDPTSQHGRIQIRGLGNLEEEILRPGEWGLFRLLEAASKIEPGTEAGKRGGPPTTVATWALRMHTGTIKMDIRPSDNERAFPSYLFKKQRIFKQYQCPKAISGR